MERRSSGSGRPGGHALEPRLGATGPHVAFDVALEDLLRAHDTLKQHGVAPLSFFGEPANEPSVIGWMPAAAVYFRDPDGHLLEYLAMLPDVPRPGLGIVTWSEWQ